jgi:hypothetical protein
LNIVYDEKEKRGFIKLKRRRRPLCNTGEGFIFGDGVNCHADLRQRDAALIPQL